MKATSLEEFYQEIKVVVRGENYQFLPTDIHKEIGHFNVFYVLRMPKGSMPKG